MARTIALSKSPPSLANSLVIVLALLFSFSDLKANAAEKKIVKSKPHSSKIIAAKPKANGTIKVLPYAAPVNGKACNGSVPYSLKMILMTDNGVSSYQQGYLLKFGKNSDAPVGSSGQITKLSQTEENSKIIGLGKQQCQEWIAATGGKVLSYVKAFQLAKPVKTGCFKRGFIEVEVQNIFGKFVKEKAQVCFQWNRTTRSAMLYKKLYEEGELFIAFPNLTAPKVAKQ